MTADTKPFADRIWDFFCSLKLTIVLLLLLAATSIIGTVIQQNAPAADYIREYGQTNYELFVKLQFTDMYHSAWFMGILGLFCVNLICCSIKNFPRAWRFVSKPTLIAPDGLLKNSANKASFSSKRDRDLLASELAAALKKEFATPRSNEAEGRIHLFAQKGIYSRFGAYMTHLSILIVIFGAIIGTLWGEKGYVNIVEGTQVDRFQQRSGEELPLGFTLRCEDFTVEYYPGSNRPKDYFSDLIILENDQHVMIKGLEKTRIEVNKPLTYRGYTFYQSSYGPAGNTTFKFRITGNTTKETQELSARAGEKISLGNGYSFVVTNYASNYSNFGPAVQMRVTAPDGAPGNPFIVLQNYPDFDAKRGGAFSFSLLAMDQLQYTGLQVAKDPGVEIVWAGCFLMVFGSLTAFFFSHRRIWICLEKDGNKTSIQMIGNAHRNQAGFSLSFNELQQKIEAAINGPATDKE